MHEEDGESFDLQHSVMQRWFTSFCKNVGTDLLIFFRWSGSENKDEEGDDIDEATERLIGRQRTNDLQGLKK